MNNNCYSVEILFWLQKLFFTIVNKFNGSTRSFDLWTSVGMSEIKFKATVSNGDFPLPIYGPCATAKISRVISPIKMANGSAWLWQNLDYDFHNYENMIDRKHFQERRKLESDFRSWTSGELN